MLDAATFQLCSTFSRNSPAILPSLPGIDTIAPSFSPLVSFVKSEGTFGWKPSHPTPVFPLYCLDTFSNAHSSNLGSASSNFLSSLFQGFFLQIHHVFLTLPMHTLLILAALPPTFSAPYFKAFPPNSLCFPLTLPMHTLFILAVLPPTFSAPYFKAFPPNSPCFPHIANAHSSNLGSASSNFLSSLFQSFSSKFTMFS